MQRLGVRLLHLAEPRQRLRQAGVGKRAEAVPLDGGPRQLQRLHRPRLDLQRHIGGQGVDDRVDRVLLERLPRQLDRLGPHLLGVVGDPFDHRDDPDVRPPRLARRPPGKSGQAASVRSHSASVALS